MPAAASQGGGQSDNSAGILWGIAAVFAGLGAVWYGLKDQIVWVYLTLKLYEVTFLNYLTLKLNFYPGYFTSIQTSIQNALANPNQVAFNDLITLGDMVGDWLRYPFIAILLVLAVVVYISNTARSFRQIYALREFAKLEQQNWPQITPVVNLDLIKTDIDTGPWAMAMTPIQFCKRYRLLEEVRPIRGTSRRDSGRVEVMLKRGAANQLFSMQLGPLWVGVDKLPMHTRALFAAFAARINSDTKSAADLLNQLNRTSTTKLDYTGVDDLIKKHYNTKIVQWVVQSHAYVSTIMASMLEEARQDGVQASADFLWLKPLDRRLWYTLNTVGRQTPFIEVAGIFAHWIAEKEAQRRLRVPMVEEATNAVELALKDVVYRPDEPA